MDEIDYQIIIPFHACTETCEWVQSDAQSEYGSETMVGWVKSEEECLSKFYAQCSHEGYSMANIEYENNSGYIGKCWCQKGKDLIIDDDPCCKTVWGANCDVPGTYSEIHVPFEL